MRSLRWVLSFSLCCLATHVGAAEPALSPGAIKELISQLGDDSFKAREVAARRLLDGGPTALAALSEALKEYDLEIRLRAQQLLAEAEYRDLNRKLAALLADDTGEQDHPIPCWSRFKKTLGSGQSERELFVEMIRSEMAMLEVIDKKPSECLAQFQQRMQVLQFQMYNNPFGLPVMVSPGSMASLLFVAMDQELLKNPQHLNNQYMMFNLLNDQRIKDNLRNAAYWPTTRRMLERWIMSNTAEHIAINCLMLAFTYEMNHTGRDFARKVLEKPSNNVHTQAHAILALGRFGGPDDFALVEKQLANKTECQQWNDDQKKKPIRVELRDVALAVLIHLSNQQPKEFGFAMVQENPQFLYHMHTLGFREQTERDAALKKWQEWVQKRDAK